MSGCCSISLQQFFAELGLLPALSSNFLPLKFWRSLLQVFLVFGKSGWIGGLVGELLKSQSARFEYAEARLEDRAGVLADIERVRHACLLLASKALLTLSVASVHCN